MHYLENDRIRIAVAAHGAELCGIYDKSRSRHMAPSCAGSMTRSADMKWCGRQTPNTGTVMRLYSFLLSERYAAASTATKG